MSWIRTRANEKQQWALQMVEKALRRIARGAISLGVHQWHLGCCAALHGNEKMLNKNNTLQAAFKLIGRALIRMVKSQLGLCLHDWNRACNFVKEAEARAAKEGQQRLQKMSWACRALERVLVKMVRGQLGLCVHDWSRACKLAKEAEARAVEQGQQRLQKMSWACRALERVLVKMVRGQLGLCVHDWNRACKLAKEADEADARVAEVSVRVSHQTSAGLRRMQKLLIQMVRFPLPVVL